MSDEQINTTDEPDSLSWGSAAKGTQKKVYGNIEDDPVAMGLKVARIKLLEKFALGEIDWNVYKELVKDLQ